MNKEHSNALYSINTLSFLSSLYGYGCDCPITYTNGNWNSQDDFRLFSNTVPHISDDTAMKSVTYYLFVLSSRGAYAQLRR